MSRFRCTIIACARWETTEITEWLIYHAGLGFDHVYLYCNDDDPAELYREVLPFLSGPSPFVTFVHFPFIGYQREMYLHALRAYKTQCNWVMFLDIDEFLHLPQHAGINDYIHAKCQATDVVHFNWVMFGNSGYLERPVGDVLALYTLHQAALHPFTKVLVRADGIDVDAVSATGLNFWHDWPLTGGISRVVNALGDPMDGYYQDFPSKAVAYLHQPGMLTRMLESAAICHYCLKSEADFQRRVDRGTAGNFAAQLSWGEKKTSGESVALLESLNTVEFLGIKTRWEAMTGRSRQTSILAPMPGRNVALGKPALQSSISVWSIFPNRVADAAGAVSGAITGRHQFHTDEDDAPWWQVDLGALHTITGVRLYNRLDAGQHRASRFMLSHSADGGVWSEFYRRQDAHPFGGLDGFPFQWCPDEVIKARFIRITLTERNFLHLDQVEIFGTSLSDRP